MTAGTAAPSPWKLGDFHVIGRNQNAGDALCEDCGVGAGARVLDVACGSGNTALAAARHGAAHREQDDHGHDDEDDDLPGLHGLN